MKHGERERDLFSLLYACVFLRFIFFSFNKTHHHKNHPILFLIHQRRKKERKKEARKNERRW